MPNCAGNTSRGHKFAMAAYNTESSADVTTRFAPSAFGLRAENETVRDDGIAESLWEHKGDEVLVAQGFSGNISVKPRAANLQAFCLAIFGGDAFASNAKLPGDLCKYFHLEHFDPNTDHTYRYNNCVTSQAVFSGQTRQLVQLDWSVNAGARVISSGESEAMEELTLSTQQPFAVREGALVVGARTLLFNQFNLTVDNDLQIDYFNRLTAPERPSGSQTFVLTHDSPWDSADDVALLSAAQEVAASITFTSGTKQLKFEFPCLFSYVQEPEVRARQRITNGFSWRAKFDPASATAAPVKITVVAS